MSVRERFQKFLVAPYELLLIRQARLGDKEAFGKLYTLYLDKIYRFVYFRVGQKKELAEDIVSDIFVKAWEKIENFKDDLPSARPSGAGEAARQGSFQAWLYMIARNKVIDYYRGARPQVALAEDIHDETKNVEDSVLQQLEIEKVKEALAQLTPEQQEVIILKFIEDVSHKEIAAILGKREDAIRALSSRAIRELKRILNLNLSQN